MRRDRLSGQAVGDARRLGEAVAVHEAVSRAQERELAVHRHHGKLRHVLAVRDDDAEPVAPAGYGEALRPGGRILPGTGYQRMERSSMPPSRMAPERSSDQLVW